MYLQEENIGCFMKVGDLVQLVNFSSETFAPGPSLIVGDVRNNENLDWDFELVDSKDGHIWYAAERELRVLAEVLS